MIQTFIISSNFNGKEVAAAVQPLELVEAPPALLEPSQGPSIKEKAGWMLKLDFRRQ